MCKYEPTVDIYVSPSPLLALMSVYYVNHIKHKGYIMSILESITPTFIKEFNDGIQSTLIDPLNIMVTNLDKENKAIADSLLAGGVTPEQIKHFVDVSRAQLDPYLDEQALRASIRAEILAEQEPTPTVKK